MTIGDKISFDALPTDKNKADVFFFNLEGSGERYKKS